MTHDPVKKRGLPALVIPCLLLATLACSLLSGGTPQTTPSNTPAAAGGVTPTGAAQQSTPSTSGPTPAGPTPVNTPAASGPTPGGPTPTLSWSGDVVITQALTFGTGPFNLPNPQVGLSDLSSYTATLTVSFDGTNNGQPAKWSRTYVMSASQKPAVRQLNIQTSGDVSDTQPVYMAEIDGADYEVHGEDLCTANAIGPGKTPGSQWEPAGYLNFVAGAEAAGSDTVNNVAAQHYTFDQRALGQQNLAQSSGELWVAAAGGYLVKYLVTTKATQDYFGAGIAGTLTEDYELSDVGQPVTVQLPAGCPGGMVNAPLLPGASNEVNSPGVLTYDTPTSVADAVAFYQKQIPPLGWTLQDTADITATHATLDFQMGDQEMTIDITSAASAASNAGVTTVAILVVRAQK